MYDFVFDKCTVLIRIRGIFVHGSEGYGNFLQINVQLLAPFSAACIKLKQVLLGSGFTDYKTERYRELISE